jgi:ribonuclease P protein component
MHGRTVFARAYADGRRRSHFPLALRAYRREDNGPSALGLAVPKRCGNAPQRNLIKRRLREAFRLAHDSYPPGHDWLILVRPHAALPQREYARILLELLCAS